MALPAFIPAAGAAWAGLSPFVKGLLGWGAFGGAMMVGGHALKVATGEMGLEEFAAMAEAQKSINEQTARRNIAGRQDLKNKARGFLGDIETETALQMAEVDAGMHDEAILKAFAGAPGFSYEEAGLAPPTPGPLGVTEPETPLSDYDYRNATTVEGVPNATLTMMVEGYNG